MTIDSEKAERAIARLGDMANNRVNVKKREFYAEVATLLREQQQEIERLQTCKKSLQVAGHYCLEHMALAENLGDALEAVSYLLDALGVDGSMFYDESTRLESIRAAGINFYARAALEKDDDQ